MLSGTSKDKALAKAQNICAKMEKCRGDIRQKLFEWKVEKPFHDEILEQLIKDKFIDEKRFVQYFVRDKYKLNKWGKLKIDYALRAKEISSETIEYALENIDLEEYTDICRDLLQKRLKTLANDVADKQKVKLIRFGQSRGYEGAMVYKIVENLFNSQEHKE